MLATIGLTAIGAVVIGAAVAYVLLAALFFFVDDAENSESDQWH